MQDGHWLIWMAGGRPVPFPHQTEKQNNREAQGTMRKQ